MKKIKMLLVSLLGCVAFAGTFAQTAPPPDDIDYKIVIPQQSYDPGGTATILLLIVNRGKLPIYLKRNFAGCSSWATGYAEVKLLDSIGRNISKEKNCVIDGYLTDPVAALKDARFWIALGPGEVYGALLNVDLPNQKGKYRLVSELFPPGFSDENKGALAEQQMKVLQNRHPAESEIVVR